ncbi:MAG: cell division protein FtsQ/DivIB [bacterium]
MRKKKFFVRRHRAYSPAIGLNNIAEVLRNALISLLVTAVFLAAAGVIIKYFVEKNGIEFRMPDIFSRPAYIMIKEDVRVIYTDGRAEIIPDEMGLSSFPVISGVNVNEKREEHKKALKQALKIKPRYLAGISEIIINDPDNIILITLDGKKIYAGDRIDNDKMKRYKLVSDKAGELGKRYSAIDMRYKNRVIIK